MSLSTIQLSFPVLTLCQPSGLAACQETDDEHTLQAQSNGALLLSLGHKQDSVLL
jgi:hypothetical protein